MLQDGKHEHAVRKKRKKKPTQRSISCDSLELIQKSFQPAPPRTFPVLPAWGKTVTFKAPGGHHLLWKRWVRTSPNIWLVFDGLRERTRKIPAAWHGRRIREERTKGKEWKERGRGEGETLRKEEGKTAEKMKARATVHERSGG